MRLAVVVLALAFAPRATAAPPALNDLELHTDHLSVLGVSFPECDKPVFRVSLHAKVDAKGEGVGTLTLDPSYLTFDEFGAVTGTTAVPAVKLDCTLKFVKKTTVKIPQRLYPGGPESDDPPIVVEWKLYAVTGPKLTSKVSVALAPAAEWRNGRLVVHGADGKVKYAVGFRPPPPAIPCHPGCFPTGTPVLVPGGSTTVEKVKAGDTVTTIGPTGVATEGRVEKVFVTTNRLFEVKTSDGRVVTTEVQPLALTDGTLRAAGQLKRGDQVWRWESGARRAATVESVTPTGRTERVFNLILKDSAVFVAGRFLARSKPPADGP